jgi:uncharacterized protein YcnI
VDDLGSREETTVRRLLVPVAACAAASALGAMAAPAAAHSEWEPATAAPGSVVELTLFLEDEQPSAGTNRVDLQFPEPIVVVALPEVPGWTATLVDGEVGGPASGVTWTGGPAPDDLHLPITLGPLPAEPGRLQFRAVQTYDNGAVDNWIEDWPEGAPEPDNPGPVLDLVPGGPGSIPATTTTASTTTTTTLATTTTEAQEEAAAEDEEDDGDSIVLPVVIAVVVVLAAAGGAFAVIRARRSSET